MMNLPTIGAQIAAKRKELGLSQTELAQKAQIGRSTLDALENGRIGELGYSKILRLLTALGLELRLQEASRQRPTLEDLLNEDDHD
jgi:transcriptional regulator with XRE-family HTH domain